MMRPADYVNRDGRPTSLERAAWQEHFALTDRKSQLLTTALLRQLSACRSDEARKLLLGVQ